jgi:hypothetical protein
VSAATGTLGGLGSLVWTVPTLVVSVPGLLLLIAILAQALGGAVWIPLIRRKIGGFSESGDGRRGRPLPR